MPLGWDSPGYAWRTTLAKALGVGGLPSTIPYPGPVNPGRPGFLVLGGIVSAIGRVEPLRITAVLPAVMAASAALAWGATVRVMLGWSRWRACAMALFVGTSPFAVHAIDVEGYQDATMALAVFSAAVLAVLLAVRQRRFVWPAAILVAAAGTIHWSFVPVVEAILVLTALALLPSALRARARAPDGEGASGARLRLRDSATARLAVIGLAGAAMAAFWIVVLLRAGLPHAQLVVGQLLDKLRRDVPQEGLWFVLPLAAAGALSLAGDEGAASASEAGPAPAGETSLLFLCLAWCEVALAAVAAVWVLGWPIPGHRVLAFCLALPALAAVGLLAVADRIGGARTRRSNGSARRAAAIAVVIAGLLLSAWWAGRAWQSYHPVMRAGTVVEARTAAMALDLGHVPTARPVVFVLDDHGRYAFSRVWIAAHTIRAELPAARVEHAYFFVGSPQDLLAGRAGTLPPETGSGGGDGISYGGLSTTYFAGVRHVLRGRFAAIVLASANPSFSEWVAAHPSLLAGPGVAWVGGEPVGAMAATALPISPLRPFGLIALALLTAAIVTVAGSGWTLTMFGSKLDPSAAAALSPAVGTAMLVLGGVLLGSVGLQPTTTDSLAIVLIVAAAGWTVPLVQARCTRQPA